MTLTDMMKWAGDEVARHMPHADLAQLPGEQGPPTENQFGEQIPGTFQPGPVHPCHADRLSAEDAVRAGLAAASETWRVTFKDAVPLTPQSTLTVTLSSGESLALTVTRLSGRLRTVAWCQRAS